MPLMTTPKSSAIGSLLYDLASFLNGIIYGQ
jgi:hypothetical protein